MFGKEGKLFSIYFRERSEHQHEVNVVSWFRKSFQLPEQSAAVLYTFMDFTNTLNTQTNT